MTSPRNATKALLFGGPRDGAETYVLGAPEVLEMPGDRAEGHAIYRLVWFVERRARYEFDEIIQRRRETSR